MLTMLADAKMVRMEPHADHASRCEQNHNDKYLLRVYSVEIILMMDSEPVRIM